MRLVAGRTPGPALGHRNDELGRPQQSQAAGELRRGHAAGEAHHVIARHGRVDKHAREGEVVDSHRLRGHGEVEAVIRDEGVEQVEVGAGAGVHLGDHALRHHQGWLGIARGVEGHEAERGVRDGEAVEVDPLGVHEAEAPDALGHPLSRA